MKQSNTQFFFYFIIIILFFYFWGEGLEIISAIKNTSKRKLKKKRLKKIQNQNQTK